MVLGDSQKQIHETRVREFQLDRAHMVAQVITPLLGVGVGG